MATDSALMVQNQQQDRNLSTDTFRGDMMELIPHVWKAERTMLLLQPVDSKGGSTYGVRSPRKHRQLTIESPIGTTLPHTTALCLLHV